MTTSTPGSAQSTVKGRVKAARGFTLIELMVVVAITGIIGAMSSVAIPKMVNASKFREQRTRITEILREARNQARTRQQCTDVVVDTAARTITWQVYQDCAGLKAALRNHTAVVPSNPIVGATRTLTLSRDMTLGDFGGVDTIVLVPPGGGLTEVTPVDLEMERRDGVSRATFSIFPAIGTVRVTTTSIP